MKKVFVEPKIKRIELNMNENIANSQTTGQMGYYFNVDLYCTIQDTTFTFADVYFQKVTDAQVANCKINSRVKIGGGTIVPAEEILPYLRM